MAFPSDYSMKIERSGTQQDMISAFITTDAGVKFVIENGEDEKIARLAFPSPDNQHAALVMDEHAFVGAGMVKRNGEVIEYGSDSCTRKFGRDRPDDPVLAANVIDEFRVALQHMLQQKP